MRVRLTPQVVEFVRRLPPEPRRRVRRALRDLAAGKGDVAQLESPLDDYCQLRVGPYRIIVSYAAKGTVDCVFAERRSIVYDAFAEMVRTLLARGE
jgi:mRNA-degrading endonuclease RelE of RelBE toxin-antitoxin system